MSSYFAWNEQIITDFSDANVNDLYNDGYVFTRIGKGVMKQIRSLRIDLSKFELSSENRRILKKTDGLIQHSTPLPMHDYHWSIGKMAKDFYSTKFGTGTFSANKVKELLTDAAQSSFNELLTYTVSPVDNPQAIGYVICFQTPELYHYSYPFYDLSTAKDTLPNLGMAMMLNGILKAQNTKRTYIYLGSFQRPGDVYKLQFKGLEWFDGERWQTDTEGLKLLFP